MIYFSHIRDTGNTGDIMSGPANWFDFPEHRVVNYDEPIGDDATAVVYGGGTMNNWLQGRNLMHNQPQVARIAWGIGSSRHGETDPWPDPRGFDLVGVREWTPEREAAGLWVPCASCMSPLFDETYEITREAVLFVNASPGIRERYPVAIGGLPMMHNEWSMAEIVAFLGSAETVVTNSYHGVYWATLLGRKVVAISYSSKFWKLRHPPAYSLDRGLDWRDKARFALQYPAALAQCRAASRAFYGRVLETIGARQAA